ncbi:hypothetical protein ACFXPS_44105 [Nocardia sp. NPDC059091]|uniref:hypothetical protein n=1 Tax=unclassified Nocardia TaxID=2637762 RepID=UPI003698FA1D
MSHVPEYNSSSPSPAHRDDDDQTELLTLDIALRLPPEMRSQSIRRSRQFATIMRDSSQDSQFLLGEPVPWGTEPAEPHVSLFMLSAPRTTIPLLADALDRIAPRTPPIDATGERYAHNPFGAPEIYFQRTPEWHALQNTVVTTFEPFRQGRVRAAGPFGEPLSAMLAGTVPAEPARLRQLRDAGYDEIGDRFNPHITEAAPIDPAFRVPFDSLPAPATVSGVLATLALYRMGPYGTCLRNYHQVELRGHPRLASRRRDEN